MEHFETGDWVDFAHGNCEPSRKSLMDKHLKDGCSKCSLELAAWAELAALGSREREYTPPAEAVRLVKAALSGRLKNSVSVKLQEVAQLVFDSFCQPLAHGVRATSSTKRQLIYRHDSMMIELSLEPGTGVDESLLIGQITDYKSPRTPSLAISVVSSAKQLAETRTNGLGEFFVEFKKQPNTWISFSVDGNKDVIIPIGDTLTNPA